MRRKEMGLYEALGLFTGAVRGLQSYSGVASGDLLRGIGEDLGHGVAARIRAQNLPSLLREIAETSRKLDLGVMQVERTDPLTFTVHSCPGCEQAPDAGFSLGCPIREGVVQAVLQDRLGVRCEVRTVQTTGTGRGSNRCGFRVVSGPPPLGSPGTG